MILSGSNKVAPVLNGLVLAGGKSVRMGNDKGTIPWHGIPQRSYMAGILQKFCEKVYISCRPEQVHEIGEYDTIQDSYSGIGPIGGILSALKFAPAVAWLVTACDLPLLDKSTIQYLAARRNIQSIATAFESPFDHLPEPLITIWEPRSYPILLSYVEQGISCPRKALIKCAAQVTLLQAPDPEALTNANTTADAEKVRAILNIK